MTTTASYFKGQPRSHLLKVKGPVSVGDFVQTNVREEKVISILHSKDPDHKDRTAALQKLIKEVEEGDHTLVEKYVLKLPSRGMKFGARPPKDKETFKDQLFAAFQLKNDFITVDIEAIEEYRAERAKIVDYQTVEDTFIGLTEQIKGARSELKDKRKKARTRVKDPELEARIKELKPLVEAASEELKAAKTLVNESKHLKSVNARLNVERKERKNKLNRDNQLGWGTKNMSREAANQASKKGIPKRKRWTFEGRIGVQVTGDRPTNQLGPEHSQNTFFQLDPLPADQWDTRSGRRHAYTKARIRIGSTADKKPIWLEFDVLQHRPLPEGTIRYAWIKVARNGNRHDYHLGVSINSEAFRSPYRKPPSSGVLKRLAGLGVMTTMNKRTKRAGTLALSLDWETTPDRGVVAAIGHDDEGNKLVVSLPSDIRRSLEGYKQKQQVVDLHFNEARLQLKMWKKLHDVPAWLMEDTTHLHAWRAPRKLVKVVRQWADERGLSEVANRLWSIWRPLRQPQWRGQVAGKGSRNVARKKIKDEGLGEDLFALFEELGPWFEAQGVADETDRFVLYLEWWRRKNNHIYQWQCSERTSARRRRKDHYRQVASLLGRVYDTILIDNRKLNVIRTSKPEHMTTDHFNDLRKMLALGEFRDCLKTFGTATSGSRSCCMACGQKKCGCDMSSSFARNWAMLRAAGVDESGVKQVWLNLCDFRQALNNTVAAE